MSAGDDALIQDYLDLFDPSKDPVLKPGWVSDAYHANEQQLARAARKLKTRRSKWFWRLFDDDDCAAIARNREALESRAEETLPAEEATDADATPPEPFADDAQRLEDLRLLERAIATKSAACKPLGFYADCVLVHIEPESEARGARRWLMIGMGQKIVRLGENIFPVHKFNALGLKLTESTVEEYAAFFCGQTVAGTEEEPSVFVAIEEDHRQDMSFPARLDVTMQDTRVGRAFMDQLLADDRLHDIDQTNRHASAFPKAILGFPLTLIGSAPNVANPSTVPDWLVVGTLLYRRSAFRVVLSVAAKGSVSMLEDAGIEGAGLSPVHVSWPPAVDHSKPSSEDKT